MSQSLSSLIPPSTRRHCHPFRPLHATAQHFRPLNTSIRNLQNHPFSPLFSPLPQTHKSTLNNAKRLFCTQPRHHRRTSHPSPLRPARRLLQNNLLRVLASPEDEISPDTSISQLHPHTASGLRNQHTMTLTSFSIFPPTFPSPTTTSSASSTLTQQPNYTFAGPPKPPKLQLNLKS